jgi:hypothetical protein
MGVPHFMVLEEDEVELYKTGRCYGEILVLPPIYKAEYDLCDKFGFRKVQAQALLATSALTTQFGSVFLIIG